MPLATLDFTRQSTRDFMVNQVDTHYHCIEKYYIYHYKNLCCGKVIFLNSAGIVCGNLRGSHFQHHCHGQHPMATFFTKLILESFNRELAAHNQCTLHGMSCLEHLQWNLQRLWFGTVLLKRQLFRFDDGVMPLQNRWVIVFGI